MLLLAVTALAACRRATRGGMNDSTFVATMAELQRIQENEELDSASRTAARQRVLQGRGLTAEAVELKARALARDPEHAAKVFQAVENKVVELARPPRPSAPASDTSGRR